jgi:hypothetical protein
MGKRARRRLGRWRRTRRLSTTRHHPALEWNYFLSSVPTGTDGLLLGLNGSPPSSLKNGNAYEEGLSTVTGWKLMRAYWKDPAQANREAIRAILTPEATKWQYLEGVSNEMLVAPESYTIDSLLLARPGVDEIQLDLMLDYATNIALYPTFHEYFAAPTAARGLGQEGSDFPTRRR